VPLVRLLIGIASLALASASGQSLDDCLKQIHDADPHKRLAAVETLRTLPPDESAVAALVEALHDKNDDVRARSAFVLGQFRENATRVVPALLDMLNDPNPVIRSRVADDLGKFGKEAAPAVPRLGALLTDPDAYVRVSAIRSLGALAATSGQAQEMIVRQLADTRVDIRCAALSALSELGESSKEYLPQFIAAMEDPNDTVREAAAGAIGKLGPAGAPALPALMAASRKAESGPFSSISAAIAAVSRKQPEVTVPLLIEALNDSGNTRMGRVVAAQALGGIGAPARSALPDLEKASREGPDWLRKPAGDALVRVSPDLDVSSREGLSKAIAMLAGEDPASQERARNALANAGAAAVPALLELLRTAPSESVQLRAVRALKGIAFTGGGCQCAEAALPVLTELAAGASSTEVQREAAGALGYFDTLSTSGAGPVVEALTKALANPGARDEAFWSLGQLGEKSASAVPAIQAILERSLKSDPVDGKTMGASLSALGQIGPAAQSAAPLVIPLLSDRYPMVRRSAMDALGGMQAPSAISLLAKELRDPVDGMRETAAQAIARIFSAPSGRDQVDETVPLLMEHLKDPSPMVRAAVVEALAWSASAGAARPVIEALSDSNGWVRQHAATGLGALIKDPGDAWIKKATLPVLIQALDDPDSMVVVYAALSLRPLGPAAAPALPSLRRALQHLSGGMAEALADTIKAIEAKQ
jgi:HEAT repeat protein